MSTWPVRDGSSGKYSPDRSKPFGPGTVFGADRAGVEPGAGLGGRAVIRRGWAGGGEGVALVDTGEAAELPVAAVPVAVVVESIGW